MSFPVDSRYETRLSGVTTIKSAYSDAVDDAIKGIYGGSKTVVSLTVDGQGYQNPASINSGGFVVAGSGNAIIGGNVIAKNITASGTIACYGIVDGSKLIADGGGAALDLRSGTAIYAQHIIGMVQTSGSALATAISIAVTSGRAAMVLARAIGLRTIDMSGGLCSIAYGGSHNADGGGTLTTIQADATLMSGFGNINFSRTSGTMSVQVTTGNTSGRCNWTVYADVTYTP